MYSLVMALLFSLALLAAPKDKLACTAKELARFDCRLTSGNYNIRLLPKTIAWNDGTWNTVDPMPLKGESVMWEKIQFQFINGWPILQLWLWEKGFSETEVQSLHWYVADAERRKFTVLAEGIVRKRRMEPVDPPPEVKKGDPKAKKVAVKPPPQPKYLYDGWETFNLKPLKGGSLEWRLNDQKKIISKVMVPAEEVKHGD
jgi:hypothetical protein